MIAWGAAEGIWRDITEIATAGPAGGVIVLMMVAALPVSLTLAARGIRSSWAAAALSALLWGTWWLYYGTGLLPNPGLRGVLVPVGLTLSAWSVLMVSIGWRVVRRRSPHGGVDRGDDRP